MTIDVLIFIGLAPLLNREAHYYKLCKRKSPFKICSPTFKIGVDSFFFVI